jgi:hypothetical protein
VSDCFRGLVSKLDPCEVLQTTRPKATKRPNKQR